MADWEPLRRRLARVDTSLTLDWDELDALVGGLPPSAVRHRAFWGGDRGQWSGFATANVVIGRSVTFVRRGSAPDAGRVATRSGTRPTATVPDVVLVSCSKRKSPHEAPAADLYDSPLFRKARLYAESTDARWFILSAKYGLIAPDTVVAPYDLALTKTSRQYRRAWAQRVIAQLRASVGELADLDVEIHAGRKYTADLAPLLRAEGASVFEPLDGLTQGRRLAWYAHGVDSAFDEPKPRHPDVPSEGAVVGLLDQLRDTDRAVTPTELVANRDRRLASAGMYSWWVDSTGADDLSHGLGHAISPGIIYAGLAGATRRRSRRRSTNTLRGRLVGMHLGSNFSFSTFRYSLGSTLAVAWQAPTIDEARLTEWMHAHLRVVAVAVADPDTLEDVEDLVLAALDPPLNLSKVSRTPQRVALSEIRRRYPKH